LLIALCRRHGLLIARLIGILRLRLLRVALRLRRSAGRAGGQWIGWLRCRLLRRFIALRLLLRLRLLSPIRLAGLLIGGRLGLCSIALLPRRRRR